MTNITLKQLRYFEAVAKFRHFGKAAEACSISQPALSVQIKELERELNNPLFDRSGKKIRLTGFGEAFEKRVQAALQKVDDLSDFARAAQGQMIGKLRLGIIPTIAPYYLPRLIHHLGADYSGMEIQVRETLTPKLLTELTDGRIDMAILALPISDNQFEEVALFREDFVLVRSGADADKPIPDKDMLREMKLLLLEEGHCFRDQALAFCNIRSALTKDGLEASSLSTLVQMVGAGLGVTLIPDMAVEVETKAAPVSISRFDSPKPERTVGVIWRKNSPISAHLKEISQSIYQCCRNGRAD